MSAIEPPTGSAGVSAEIRTATPDKIEAIDIQRGVQVIKAVVPLAKMFGYSTSLRSATQGRGTFTMQFSHFDRN